MEPATTNIDAAADFAADGKIKEAQACYRAAIAALDRIEQENPERAVTPEFATVRNKRAYVNAALDSMLLAEARDNAKAVSVTDTTELEVRMQTKPWQEFLTTYGALTNADRLVSKRMLIVESPWARSVLDSVLDDQTEFACASNRLALQSCSRELAMRRGELEQAYLSTARAVAHLERFSKATTTHGGVRIFDVCKGDVRKGVARCKALWPPLGELLDKANSHLGGLHDILLAAGARRDFPAIASNYVEKVAGANMEDLRKSVRDQGYLRTCQRMLEEMNACRSGVVYRGTLYRLQVEWGRDDLDVPVEEDDLGLVHDEGDRRPEVENQIDAYMEKERKNTKRMTAKAEKARAEKSVESEIQKLLQSDAKSRKARLLQAGEDLRNGDTVSAKTRVDALLAEKPNDGAALNMLAAIETSEGDLKAAERTLDRAIQSNPRDYHAYYNMACVYLQRGNVDGARRYYETGRSFAGPKDKEMERAVMSR